MKKKSIVDELFKLGVDIFDSVYFLIKKTNQIDFFIYIFRAETIKNWFKPINFNLVQFIF